MRPYTRYPPTFDQDGGRGEGSDGSSGNDFSYPKKESIGEGTASEGSQRQLSKSCETGLDIYLAQSAFTTSRVRRAVTLLVLRNMGEEEKEEEEEEQRRRAEENRDDRRERREEREEEDLELTAERVFTLHRITFLDSFTSESPHIRGGAMTCRTVGREISFLLLPYGYRISTRPHLLYHIGNPVEGCYSTRLTFSRGGMSPGEIFHREEEEEENDEKGVGGGEEEEGEGGGMGDFGFLPERSAKGR
ncbi:hypothetical protein HZH66_007252 [Vespula vulgaris]|uniref:Uncharacterized protein n=1 Tax=Vespula vulgaris TaxID=7454 RepID=A0A834N4F2_VESVU|nr:hypothetical protein HZH66_007252 [Vespula vulgaris]